MDKTKKNNFDKKMIFFCTAMRKHHSNFLLHKKLQRVEW